MKTLNGAAEPNDNFDYAQAASDYREGYRAIMDRIALTLTLSGKLVR